MTKISRRALLIAGAIAAAVGLAVAIPSGGVGAALSKGDTWHGVVNGSTSASVTVGCAPGARRGVAASGQTIGIAPGGTSVERGHTSVVAKLGKSFRFEGFTTKSLDGAHLPCAGSRTVTFRASGGGTSTVAVRFVGVAS